MVKIRLQRLGRKRRPFFRLVAIDERRARNGKPLENLGFLNPVSGEQEFRLLKAPTLKWYFNGARATERAYALMKRAGVVEMIRLVKTKKMTLDEAIAKAAEEDKSAHEAVVQKAEEERTAAMAKFSPSVIKHEEEPDIGEAAEVAEVSAETADQPVEAAPVEASAAAAPAEAAPAEAAPAEAAAPPEEEQAAAKSEPETAAAPEESKADEAESSDSADEAGAAASASEAESKPEPAKETESESTDSGETSSEDEAKS